jgi:hypothetical protein
MVQRSLPRRVPAGWLPPCIDADAGLLALRPLACLLGHRTLGWPVHVEVVREYELRARLRRAVEDSTGQRREQLDPLCIRGLGAVVDDGRTGARPAGTVRRGNIGCDMLDTLRHVRHTRPRHGPHR